MIEDSNPVSRGLLLPAGAAVPLDSVQRTLSFVPTWFQAFAGTAIKRQSLLADTFKAQFTDRDGARVFLNQIDVAGQLAGRDPLNQAL